MRALPGAAHQGKRKGKAKAKAKAKAKDDLRTHDHPGSPNDGKPLALFR